MHPDAANAVSSSSNLDTAFSFWVPCPRLCVGMPNLSYHMPAQDSGPGTRTLPLGSLLAIALCIGLVAPLTGCASLPPLPWFHPPLDAEAGLYKSAVIKYRVDAGQQSLPVSIARVEGQRVSYDQVASRPETGSALGILSIHYPHPAGRGDMAEVRLAIESQQAPRMVWWKPATYRIPFGFGKDMSPIAEEWALDISKADLDVMLNELRREGFFSQNQPSVRAASLSVEYNGYRVRKNWSQVSALEGCMQRVRREGQLLVLHRPATPASAVSMTSSVDAYRALVAQGGGGDLPGQGQLASSGLLMPAPLPGNIPAQPLQDGEQIARLPAANR
jgi:hypothetical protein